MTSMARRVLIRVAEVVELVSALTSSRVDAEDSASNRPTIYLDSSLAAKIHLLTSSAMIPSQRSEVAVVRRNQINRKEEDSKPLVAWVEASSTMTTSSVGASGAASEVDQCSRRCSRLAVEAAADINQSRSRALVAWVAAWANLCHNRPTSRMESVSLAPKPRQLMLKATDKLKSKRKQMMVVETSQ